MRASAEIKTASDTAGRLQRLLPIAGWLRNYSRDDFGGDLTAGIITAILLVPQGMAFAMLAGLPAQVGLYASILPPVLYALFGTSRTLAVGPVSVAAIMVAYALQGLPPGTDPIAAALVLALLSGVILLGMGALKLGVVANFLSHPVLSGFTTAAAIIIVLTQLPSLAGLQLPEGWRPADLPLLLSHASLHPVTLLIGICSAALLLATGRPLQRALIAIGLNPLRAGIVSRTGPLIVVLLATVVVTLGGFAGSDQVAVVGAIPGGFPVLGLQFPSLEFTLRLLPAAFFISLVGYVESVSIAKVLASRRRERIDPNQELIGLGAANAAAAIAGGMPVAGGFSRTMVNYGAGARTQLASIITAALVALVTVFFTPLLENVPRAALAAIIIIAVVKLIDVRGAMAVWRYDRVDGAVFALTVAGVLAIGIEAGLALGIAASLASFAWRAARPHVAVIGRIRGSEHVIEWRRDIHQHPELGNRELRTAALVAEHLRRGWASRCETGWRTPAWSACSAAAARAGGGAARRHGRAAGHRVQPTCRSPPSARRVERPGGRRDARLRPRHPRGHPDGRGRGAGRLRDELPGTVKFIFQPAEEGRRRARRAAPS
jgi:sulfate permease, SulP family